VYIADTEAFRILHPDLSVLLFTIRFIRGKLISGNAAVDNPPETEARKRPPSGSPGIKADARRIGTTHIRQARKDRTGREEFP
jgi:hypothetical protein